MRARARKRFVSNERRSSIRLLEAVSSFTSGKKKQFWWENFYYSRLSLSSPPSQLIEQEVFFRNTLWDVTEVRNVAGSNEKYFFFKTIKKRCKRSTMQTLKSYSGAQLIERNRVPNSNVVGINDLDQNKKRKKKSLWNVYRSIFTKFCRLSNQFPVNLHRWTWRTIRVTKIKKNFEAWTEHSSRTREILRWNYETQWRGSQEAWKRF